MGINRKASQGGRSKDAGGIVQYVETLASALKIGIVTLPRYCNLYRRSIIAAFDGNLEQLEWAINSNKARGNIVVGKKKDSPILAKWKSGMMNHFEQTHYILAMFLQLLTDYWRVKDAEIDTLSTSKVGELHSQRNQLFSSPESYLPKDCLAGKITQL